MSESNFLNRVLKSNFFPNFTREQIAARNLLLFDKYQQALILFPWFIGLVVFYTQDKLFSVGIEGVSSIFSTGQSSIILNFILSQKFTVIVLIAYLLSFKWADIRESGNYGYWLGMGIQRRRFMTYIYLGFLFNIFIGIFLSLFFLLLPGLLTLPSIAVLKILFGWIASLYLLISIALFIGETLNNAELSMFFVIVFYGLVAFLLGTENPVANMIYLEYYYDGSLFFVYWIADLAVAGILYYITQWIHGTKDVELGG